MEMNGTLFWFAMGMVFILIATAFRAYALDRGWVITWWKGLLALAWYVIFTLSFYAWGTLIGEHEGSAGLKLFLAGMFVCVVLGAGLVRLLARHPRAS